MNSSKRVLSWVRAHCSTIGEPDEGWVIDNYKSHRTWFRPGSAYTANGILDFFKKVEVSLPANIAK